MKNKKLKIVEVTTWMIFALVIVFLSGLIIAKDINYSHTVNEDIMPYDYANIGSYKVQLNANNYYGDTMGEGNQYIGSLVNNVNMDFKYNLNTIYDFDSTVTYKITSTLIIDRKVDISVNNLLTENNEILNKTINNTTSKISIDETVSNDYAYYNDYVKQYKTNYDLSSLDAKIVYTFTVNVDGVYDDTKLNNTSTSTITIPLLEPTFTITKNNTERTYKTLYKEKTLPIFKNIPTLLCAIFFLLFGLCFLIPLYMAIKEVRDQDAFKNQVKKYLHVYDDIIVESSVLVDLTDKELIAVTNFNDLLDAEQELHVPIVYTEKEYNREGWFTITTNNQVWRYILRNEK